jgi:alpha-1,2-mannosyltransferase
MSELAGRAGTWRAVLVAIPLVIGVLLLAYHAKALVGIDFDVYSGAAGTLLAGKSLYGFLSVYGFPYNYPPIAAFLLVPFALLPAAVAMGVWTFLSVLSLEVVVWLTLRQLGVTDPVTRLRRTALFTVLGLAIDSVVFNLWAGQINILLMVLIFVDLFTATGRFRGVLIGIAAGIKLTPLIFIPYLLFTRRFREAAVTTATFAVTVLIGFAVTPSDGVTYWTKYVLQLNSYVSRITDNGNVPFLDASIRGLLARLNMPNVGAVYLAIAVVVAVLGVALAVWASRRGDELIGVMACGITGLLVSPVSWIFHWVWFVPLFVIWTVRASSREWTRRKLGVALVWLGYWLSTWWVVRQIRELSIPAPVNHFFANLQIAVGIGALIGFAVHLRRTADTPAHAPDPLP